MCLLCGDPGRPDLGPLLPGLQVHLLCLKFSRVSLKTSGQPPTEVEVIREVRRTQDKSCVYCKRKGAFVNCGIKQCQRSYHYHCGIAHGALNQFDKHVSYCFQHRPLPLLPPRPLPLCLLCHAPVTEDWLQCQAPGCKGGLHRGCVQTRADTGDRTCPGCGDTDHYSEEMNFFGIWFRDTAADAAFVEKASGSPSEVMKAFAKEVYQNFKSDQIDDATKINVKASFRSSKDKLNPIGLLQSQNSDSFNSVVKDPTDVKVEGINRLTGTDSCSSIEFVNLDSDSCSSVASYKQPLSRTVNFDDIMTVDSESSSRASSRERDSSPAHRMRRKLSVQSGRSPNKRVVNELRRKTARINQRLDFASTSDCDSSTNTELHGPPALPAGLSILPAAGHLEPEKSKSVSGETKPPTSKVFNRSPPKKQRVRLEFQSESSDGFLSDIDDILTGNIEDPQSHPMKEAIFSNKNKHLATVLEKINSKSEQENLPKVVRIDSSSDTGLDNKEKRKRGRPKKKVESPRRGVLKKAVSKKFATPSEPQETATNTKKSQGKVKTKTVRYLPLAERRIFHGLNWVPMSEAREEEAECGTDWINKFSELRVDEIADINQSEKLLMTLWNRHLDRFSGPGARHMDTILLAFLKKEFNQIINKNIVRNFVGHLTSLHEAGVIKLETVLQSLVIVQLGADTSESLTTGQFGVSWSQPAQASPEASSHPSFPASTPSEVSSTPTCSAKSSPNTTVEAEPSPRAGPSPSGDHTPRMSSILKSSPMSRGLMLLQMSRSNSSKHDTSLSPVQDRKRQRMSMSSNSSPPFVTPTESPSSSYRSLEGQCEHEI